jgi:GNAT superfamily N-acetyltransferase
MTLPYDKLSNGEQFRCDLARQLKDNALIDEYTSVVNRDVAHSTSNAFRRYVNKNNLKGIVIASCHYDILEWLRPDWVFDTFTGNFYSGRYLQRPSIQIDIYRTTHHFWDTFKKHHYLSMSLNKASHCYAGIWNNNLVAFGSVLRYPSGTVQNGWRAHRTVVLPDFQGLGIGNKFSDAIGQQYLDDGGRYFSRTAHPSMGNYRERSPLWKATSKNRKLRTDIKHKNVWKDHYADNTRICWSHEYIGQQTPNTIE